MGKPRVIILVFALLALRVAEVDAQVRFDQQTLANGLRVIYSPMPDTPVVHVRVMYHVGSRDERPDRQGFAHLFEHMMFRGSAHVGPEDHMRLVRAAGGMYNGQTEQDITSYFQTLPSNQLALGLYLEADRMASFHVTEPVYRVERDVVLKELLRRDESPTVIAMEESLRSVYTQHPYRWSPGGNPEHLKQADVAELQTFFDRFYVPNNAVLIISGGFDPAAAKKLVSDYFAWIPRGQDVTHNFPEEPPQTQDRSIELVKPLPQRVFGVAVRVAPEKSEDRAALMLLCEAIRFRVLRYLRVDGHELASSTYCDLVTLEDGGALCFGGQLMNSADLAEVKRVITMRLSLLCDEGILLDEVKFASLSEHLCSELVKEQQNAGERAEQLGRGALLCNDPGATDKLIRDLRQLKAPMVWRAAQKYLQPEQLNFVTIQPTSPGPKPAPPLIASDADKLAAALPVQSRAIEFPADYPRVAPIDTRIAATTFTQSIRTIEVNGLKALVAPGFKGDTVQLHLLLPRGRQDDPKGKEGLNRLTTSLFMSWTAMPQWDLEIGLPLHPPFAFGLDDRDDYTEILAWAPKAETEHLFREINRELLRPIAETPEDDLTELKWRVFNGDRADRDVMQVIAQNDLRSELFGNSPLGQDPTPASLRAIGRADIEQRRREMFDVSKAYAVVGGDLTNSEAQALLGRMLQGWKSAPTAMQPPAPVDAFPKPSTAGPKIILVDAPRSRNTIISIGARAFGRSSPDRPAADVGELILSHRIWKDIRDERGYAYAVGAGFTQFRGAGMFQINTETSVETTTSTLSILLDHIRKMQDEEVTSVELSDAKSAYAGRLIVSYQTPSEQARWRALSRLTGETDDVSQRIDQTQKVEAQDVRALFGKYAKPTDIVVVVVAPAAQLRASLDRLGSVELRPPPNWRSGAATRPAHEEIPRPY